MKIVPGYPRLFYPRPSVGRIRAAKESSGGGDKVKITTDRIVGDFMNVQVIDARAYVFPCVTTIEAANDPSMFDQKDRAIADRSGRYGYL